MYSRRLVFGFILLAVAHGGAESMRFLPDSGISRIYSQEHGWVAVSEGVQPRSGDSLVVDSLGSATLRIGEAVSVLVRGPSKVIPITDGSSAEVELVSGQVLLVRGIESIPLIISARGCSFIPVGTVAAVKITGSGDPSVAVVRGMMKIKAPTGDTALVSQGSFAGFDSAQKSIRGGTLSSRALEELTQWAALSESKEVSTTLAQQAVPVAQQSTPTPVPAVMKALPQANATPQQVSSGEAEPSREEPKPAAKESIPVSQSAVPAIPAKNQDTEETADARSEPRGVGKPSFEASAGSVTVDGAQWTRLVAGVDVPIWKFGIFFDLEFFINSQGQFSDKGWQFGKETWFESVSRKIRYIRFGQEDEPLFVKIGGLSSVTLGYGFVVDRFTNMLHYPDEKLLGLQFYLNDIGPAGLTVQTMMADFLDFKRDGGVVAGRLGVRPLKTSGIPLLENLTISGIAGVDLNQFAPAKEWRFKGDRNDLDNDGILDVAYWTNRHYSEPTITELIQRGDADTLMGLIDTTFRDSSEALAVIGGDIGLPIIKSKHLGLDLYAQAATLYDYDDRGAARDRGWGFGMPGVKVKVGPLWGQLEYRHTRGKFVSGYFGRYYFEQRVKRDSRPPLAREQGLVDQTLNGIFGLVGCNIVDAFTLEGAYSYLVGKEVEYLLPSGTVRMPALDHRFELRAGLGTALVDRIPKLSKAEVYMDKSNIWRNFDPLTGEPDRAFEKTETLYYGYRIGVDITEGAALIWDTRHGYRYDENQRLRPTRNFSIMTAISF